MQDVVETATSFSAPEIPALPLHSKPLAVAQTRPTQSRSKKGQVREKKRRQYETIINWLREQAQTYPEFEGFQADSNRRLKNSETMARWRFAADFFRDHFDTLPPDHVVRQLSIPCV